MNRLCYAIILLLLLTSTLAAQDDTAPFPVLDEAAIFADGVTVIERLPVLEIDNRSEVINYYNPQTREWEVHNFPAGVDQLNYREQSDGTYLLISSVGNVAQLPYIADKQVWVFAPANGSFEPVETVCNLMRALPNEGRWYITRVEDNFHLCHNETGQLSRSLDTLNGIDERTSDCLLNEGVQSSPDSKWLVFHNCYEQEHYFGVDAFFVYAYNVETDAITLLGLTDYSQYSYLYVWLDDDTALYIASSGGFDGANDRYAFLGNTPDFVRTEKVFYQIDFSHDVPVMQQLLTINAAGIFYRDKTIMWIEQDTQPHPIYHYNFVTGEQQLLTTLEACAVVECYIRWNDENTLGVVGAAYESPPIVPLYIYDKRIQEWIYENPFADVVRVQDDSAMMYSYDTTINQTYLLSLDLNTFTISTHGTTSYGMFSRNTYPSPDSRYVVVSDWDDETLMGVYDIVNDTVYPFLLNNANPRQFYLTQWQDDNTLIVEYYDDYYFYDAKARWHIHIDALDEEQS